MAHNETRTGDGRSRRINGEERLALIKELVTGYSEGQSIRALATSVNRSYGFVHRALSEAGVKLRKRGGRRTQAAT
ncbi:MAG TPA: helix-turn-helix domain-containing protein [Stackebrandtia sp.]|jgi:predicted transcriptional regulator|uniref:helix-turn-helix domain-containing protein n=1 Tax=Stackebrandtia sp. TaxID=2023065 RepID=UPI002D5A6C10|nr:helix-turn-helix domain-containing protein [Stackebrandtia sp.]HZE37302.1 helix-turn-helix domain-containing protein [Stackebrandtia sp.]